MNPQTVATIVGVLMLAAPVPEQLPRGHVWVTAWAGSVQGPYPSGNPVAQPVLDRVFDAQRVPEGTRIAATMFNHFLANAATEVLIKNNGQPKILGTTPSQTIWTDITVRATRDFIAAHIAEAPTSIASRKYQEVVVKGNAASDSSAP